MKFYQFALAGLMMFSGANAADITVFYSPSCPHCHHARDFIKNELIYEYNELKVTEIDATLMENRQDFIDALNKCEFTSGGVPVLVVGEKCFQGYGDSSKTPIREAIEADLTDAQKQAAAANRTKLAENHDDFVAQNANRLNAIVNNGADGKKKLNNNNWYWFIAGAIVLLVLIGAVKRKNRK